MIVIRESQRGRYRWFVRDNLGMTVAMSPTSYDTKEDAQAAYELAYRLMTPTGFWARIMTLWGGA